MSRQFPSNPWNSGEWGRTLWAGKRYWKSRSNDKKKNEQMAHMLYSVILQKIVARKVSSYVALRNCSKVIRRAKIQMVRG